MLGAGRSGTSLLMNLLVKMGVEISTDTKDSSIQNIDGTFEDSTIFNAQTSLYKSFSSNAYLPLPHWWINDQRSVKVANTLKQYISMERDCSKTIFGFKDPKTASLLPLWNKVFNATKTTPLYIYIVRNPESVCKSLVENYHIDPGVAELYWLSSNVNCLKNTGGNVFVIHYHELFETQAEDIFKNLDKHLNLDFPGNFNDLVSDTIKPEMNRSQWGSYEITNMWVKRIYKELLKVNGYNFDRSSLIKLINEYLDESNNFVGWITAAHTIIADSVKKNNRSLGGTTTELKKLTKNSNDLLIHSIELKEALQESRITILKKDDDIKQIKAEANKLRASANKLRASTSFRIGHLLVESLKTPGMNTLLLPYRMFRVLYK